MESPAEIPIPGVGGLEHTADVGLTVEAPDAGALFQRAGLGMVWLLEERQPTAATEERTVSLRADDTPVLLRAWLRELLLLHEIEARSFVHARFRTLDAGRLDAEVALAPAAPTPVREIKGVTLHGLEAEERNGTWRARVIFDV